MDLIPIELIKIGDRHRKDMGDLEELAESIRRQGQLQPIAIRPDRTLVFGERRLRVMRDILKQKVIWVHVVSADSVAALEFAENEFRKNFTPSERVAIAQTLAKELEERRGNPRVRRKNGALRGRSDDYLARKAGFGNRESLRQARKVVEQGTPKLVEAMDQGKVSLHVAATIAEAPRHKQQRLMVLDPRTIRQAARQIRMEKRCHVNGSHHSHGSSPAPRTDKGSGWEITGDEHPVACQVLIVNPPFGDEREPWDRKDVELFTEDWCCRWSGSGASTMAIFWKQELLFEGRQWLDEMLAAYSLRQLLAWTRKPSEGTRSRFSPCWEPVFLYCPTGASRHARSARRITTPSYDFHCAAAEMAPGRDPPGIRDKPLSVYRWLLDGLAAPGDKVASLFCGTALCGFAALQAGGRYYGVEPNAEERCRAVARLRTITQVRPASS